MNHSTPTNKNRLKFARESFSARLLTDPQFEECVAITNIIGREIRRSGKFKDKLGDYSYAFARSQKFDASKAENILREIFRERTGQTMNQMREALMGSEETPNDERRQKAYQSACEIGQMMEDGDKLTFNRAFATQAQSLAQRFGITDIAAKKIMADEFKSIEETELYDWGKKLDEQVFRPQIEAEKNQRLKGKSIQVSEKPVSARSHNGPA